MSPRLRTLLMTSTALLALGTVPGGAQPTGPAVVGGHATVTGAGTPSVVINQSTERAIINWHTFNISTGGAATFNQPGASSIALNRVTGGHGPSVIDGSITANGRVFIVNRDGMLFGRNAVINTAGFLATTHDIRNKDFMAGRMNFNISGNPQASIVNLGAITAHSGGFAALVAPGVRNSGTISAQLGTVALASGNTFTLDMYGDKLIQLAVGDQIAGQVIDVETGKPLSSLVTNEGTLRANGGRVEITAAAARHVVNSVINTSGTIEANTVGTRAGRIVLGGATRTPGLPKQTIQISGKISATGKEKGQRGGTIQITGEDIQFAAAMIDVSGHSGGGRILVGGNHHGGSQLIAGDGAGTDGGQGNFTNSYPTYGGETASTVTVDGATTFNASATVKGTGGEVTLWSNTLTTFAGTIFARGGEQGGNGGSVEVSSKASLAFSGLVNTLAPNGTAGTLLLHSNNMTVTSDPDGENAINVVTLTNQLAGGNVTISTSNPGWYGGHIAVSTGVTWTAPTTLTLEAYSNININAPITALNGGLTIDAGGTATASAAINVGTFTLADGNWVQNAAVLPAFHATDFRIEGGSFLRVTGGDGTSKNPYQITDVFGLQGVGSFNLLGKNFTLANNIDAGGTANWNDGEGFRPIGNFKGNWSFRGIFDGQNNTISGLTVNGETTAGLFGYNTGTIQNLNLANVNIVANTAGQTLGGLVGVNETGGTISNVSVSGTVGGTLTSLTAGGLAGVNKGTITNAHAAVNVTIGNGFGGEYIHLHEAHAGGLVGHNYGSIDQSSASGIVVGGGNALVGGLVGTNGDFFNNEATISRSWATGNVLVQTNKAHQMAVAGGLVGDNWARISSSYATGNVTMAGNIQSMHAGGLVGEARALNSWGRSSVEESYASGDVTINSTYKGSVHLSAGGLVGEVDSYATIRNVYALGNISVAAASTAWGSAVAGGLIGRLSGTVEYAYSTGTVTAGQYSSYVSTFLGGSIGSASYRSDIAGVYWDKDTSGTTTGIGRNYGADGSPTGLTTEQARTQSSYAGFNFSGAEAAWFMVDGQTRPFLRMEWSETVRNAHQLQLMAMNPGADYVLANNIDFTGQFGESGMWGARGFSPVGQPGGSYLVGQMYGDNSFNGTLHGQGFTINGLMLAPNNATMQSVGLFGTIGADGVVSNLNITNATVTANIGFRQPIEGPQVSQWVGILAGQSGGTITNVNVTGTVSGLSVAGVIAGGLVGQHGILGPGSAAGSISNSSANVNVTVGNGGECPGQCMFNAAGGLVGVNVGGSSISNSYAHGNIIGGATTWAGGLVGQNGFFSLQDGFGTIANSYATGNVTVTGAQSAAGGLVGSNAPGSTITNSQAFGAVASTFNVTSEDQNHDAGGLVGANSGIITSTTTPNALTASCVIGASFSCATGNVSVGSGGSGGGLVGSNQGTISKAFATGNVTGADGLGFNGGMTHLGGLAGTNRGTIAETFARGAIGNTTTNFVVAGGLVGDNTGTISDSTASGNVSVGTASIAGGLVGNNSSEEGNSNQGSGASNAATITNASASGNVSVGAGSFGGGFVGGSMGTIANSFATGAVTGGPQSVVGGFAAAQGGSISNSHATGNVTTETGLAGGFTGFNFGSITLSYATGKVSSPGFAFLGGFVGMNSGMINQAYATGAVTGGPSSLVGGFVGLNIAAELSLIESGLATMSGPAAAVKAAAASGPPGVITQSYALGAVTGNNATAVGGFAGLNLGTFDQIYAAGRVQGAGATLGGLIGANNLAVTLPNIAGLPSQISAPPGTATNAVWDVQTTGLTTSAGGTGMNTSALIAGLPSGFDPSVWGNPAYPYLVNLGPQITEPGTPVIPPVVDNPQPPQQLPPPADQQINPNVFNPLASSDPLPNVAQFAQQQQQQRQQQGQSAGDTTGSVAPEPVRLDVGDPNRFFYLPALNENRLVDNEVVLQMPCDVPQTVLDGILKQHNLTMLSSQCLAQGGNAAFRMRNASDQTISAVIRALAEHQIIGAAQANYLYALAETSVQSATSQQGDPGQYVPEKLRLFAAHRLVTGNNIPIGVIDSEIDGAHPDLTGAIANKYDATGIDDNPHAHGTGMAGAIVSHQKLLGVAPGARILAIRAFSTRNTNPESTTFHILKALDFAVANNVRIVNMSFAGPRDPSLERALKAAYDKGIVLIAAAGNAGPRAPAMHPAADPHVIAVTATDVDDRLFPGANRGNYVAIAAPGVDVLVPAPAGEYQVTTGTSVATAHISGVVALMLERNPQLTPADVRNILTASAKRLGPAPLFGAGLVDPVRAIELATPRSTQAPAPATVRPTTTQAPAPPKRASAVRRPAVAVAARP